MQQENNNKWLALYNPLFIVINERKEMETWQLTKKEKFSFVADTLENLKTRFQPKSGNDVKYFVIGYCCKWTLIKEVFGDAIEVKLYHFPVIARITTTLDKSHPYHKILCQDLRKVFRAFSDNGEQRLKAISEPF